MFLQLRHKKADLYILSKKIVIACNHLLNSIPAQEKTIIADHIKKSALLGHTEITKALFRRKRKKRRKRWKTAIQAYVLVDSGLEMVLELKWITAAQVSDIARDVQTVFSALAKIEKKC